MKIPKFSSTMHDSIEVDFCAKVLERSRVFWERVKAKGEEEGKPETVEAAVEALERVRTDAAAYVPRSGPVFVIGPIPGAQRAWLAGMIDEAENAGPAEKMRAVHQWQREVVRAAVRGHSGAKQADGTEVPFDAVLVDFLGLAHPAPSEHLLELYARAGILPDLASIALEFQRLGADGKNG